MGNVSRVCNGKCWIDRDTATSVMLHSITRCDTTGSGAGLRVISGMCGSAECCSHGTPRHSQCLFIAIAIAIELSTVTVATCNAVIKL